MGSPVSAVIAELVMQEIESEALETSPVNVRWWRRYMDASNSCLKKSDVQTFHDHLNSIKEHIQFTIERSTVSEQGESITFLDKYHGIGIWSGRSSSISKSHTPKSIWHSIHTIPDRVKQPQ